MGGAACRVLAALGARASRSAGLAAIARDNGSDALSSALVAIALLAARSGVEWAEPLATVVIGLVENFYRSGKTSLHFINESELVSGQVLEH